MQSTFANHNYAYAPPTEITSKHVSEDWCCLSSYFHRHLANLLTNFRLKGKVVTNSSISCPPRHLSPLSKVISTEIVIKFKIFKKIHAPYVFALFTASGHALLFNVLQPHSFLFHLYPLIHLFGAFFYQLASINK